MKEKNFSRKSPPGAVFFIMTAMHVVSGGLSIAAEPLKLSLTPKVLTPSINIGQGTKIYLSVPDQRKEKILGYYGSVQASGPISATENVAEVIQKSLKNGLSGLGFEFLAAPESSAPRLEVAVRDITYRSPALFEEELGKYRSMAEFKEALRNRTYWSPEPSSGTYIGFNVGFKAKLSKGDTLLYEKSYHYFRGQKVFCMPDGTCPEGGQAVYCRPGDKSCLEKNFNAGLSDLMGQLLADVELLKALR